MMMTMATGMFFGMTLRCLHGGVSGMAGAIQAAVRRAELAGLLQPLPQLLARTMQTHFKVVGRDSYFFRHGPGRPVLKVDELKHLRIFRFQSGQERCDAGTCLFMQLVVRNSGCWIFREPLQSFHPRGATAMKIRQDISQDS